MEVIDRSLFSGAQDEIGERFLRLRVRLAASQSQLWTALVKREDLAAWLGESEGELVLGGSFALKDNASGRIHRCEPEKLFEVDWNYGDIQSRLRVELGPADSGTLLTLTHSLPTTDTEHWLAYGPGATGVGWEISLFGLEQYLATGHALDEEQWVTTELAVALIRDSSEGWAEAHSKAGTDFLVAKKAASSTADFYLGQG